MGSRSKSSSSQASNSTNISKDNSAIVEDQAVNVADSQNVTVSVTDQGTVAKSFSLAEDSFDFGEYLADESFGFANNTIRTGLQFLGDSRSDDLNQLNAGLEANRQLTDKVVSTIAEQSEPELTDLSKYSTGAIVILGLGAAYLLSKKS